MIERKYKNVNKSMRSYFRILSIFIFLFGSIITSFSSNTLMNDSCNVSLVSVDDVVCFGSSDGVITVHADSGAGIYHYYLEMYNSSFPFNGGWQSVGQVPAPGQYTTITTISFTNLPSDTFRVVLEDTANQCFDTIGFPVINLFVLEPTQIIVSESVTNATNVVTSDGSVILSVSGGGPPYIFSWTGPNGFSSSSQNINNLQYGIYYYSLTDTNGCVITDSVYVDASQACSYGSFTSVPPICFGDGNGQILINSVYGSSQFTYLLELQDPNTMSWNFVNSATVVDSFYTFTNLYSGTYQYTLTDANGCSITSPQINVQDPTPISSNNTITLTTSSTNCDGQILSIINGGVAPITHNWTGPNSFISNLPIITNLCVGTYCDSVVDANGCNAILCDFVDFEPPCSPEVEVYNIFCEEDSSGFAIVTKTNNAYPLFVWIHDFTGDTISMDTFAVNLPSGDYTFNAYNLGVPGACPDTSISFSIISPEVNVLSLNGDTICEGDSTSFFFETINTDTSFIYQVLISNDILFVDDTSSFYPSGNYNYTVEVDTGNGFVSCFTNQNIEIIDNDLSIDSVFVTNEICATSLGSIEVSASSSFNPINFSLDTNYQSSNLFSNLNSSYYNLSVMDGMNCVILQDSVLVDLDSRIVLDVDSALETCRLNDGWISVIAQDGYGGYQYSIDSGVSFSSTIYSDTLLIDSLVKGNYYLVVRDDSMCVYDYGNIYIGKTPRPKIDSIHMKNESCCGWDGEITIFSTPQNSISIYSLDTFNTSQNSNVFDSLIRGDYLIYIEDTNACLDSIEVTLEADSTPNINLTVGITDVVCNGDSNGTFKVYYPDSCYIYELHRYTFFTPTLVLDTGDYFNELISGFYGIRAISNSGTCFDSSAVKFIDEPIPISFDPPVITDVRCLNNDSCNGEVYLPIEPTGGVSPYYYYLKDIDNNIPMGVLPYSQKFEYLCPSEYEIQIVDGNACVVYDTIVVADSSLYIDSFSVQNVQCYNGDDGVVEVFVSGGIGNYSYLWSNSDTTNIADSLSGGEYFISVIDSVGCFAFDSIYLSDPDTLQFDILGKKDETCMGVTNDGEIYLGFYGGTPPYNFMWSSYSGFSGNSGYGFGDTIFNLTYDTIIIDVTDANYCSASPVWVTQSVTIVDALNSSNPLSFDSIYLPENPICFGTHTAFINIDLNGGDDPIQYSIDSMNSWSALDSFAQLNAGKYNIYVQDAYGCLDSAIVNIIEYDEITINYDSVKHVSCYNGNDGYISVSNSGGVSPYSYLWIPTNETTNQISDLYAVPHIIKVTDSVNCVVVDTIDLYELTEPIQTISSVVNIVSCFEGNDGELSASTIGGMLNYNYIWINEDSDTVSTNENATGLTAGSYLVFVSDSFNCGPASDSIILASNSEIDIDILNIIDNICFGDNLGEFTLDVSGGVPNYFISLLDEDNTATTSYNTTISNLVSSDYMIWVTDANGCVSDTTFNVKLGDPGRIQIHNNLENLSCYMSEDGVMNLSFLSGTPPYNYVVEYDNMIIDQSQVNQAIVFNLTELSEGDYYISVTDFNSCFVDSVFYVSEPDEIIADFIPLSDFGRESFSFEAENTSVGGQLYYWDFDNDSTKIASFLQEIKMQFANQGEYNVMMVAHDTILGHQCNDTIIKIIDVEGYDVYNVFTPNNDGINDVFHFNEWMLNGIYVEIFNRWGEKIYHWDDINSGWEGRGYNGRNVEEGVYFYRLEATGEDGAHFEENGSVTLIR